MQTKLLEFRIVLNQHRAKIVNFLVLASLIMLLIAPSIVVSAGKAASTGG